MECLIWEFLLKSGCVDIPNLHALQLEILAGIGIAVSIFLMQIREKKRRRKHAISEIAFQLLIVDKKRFELDVLVNKYFKFLDDQIVHILSASSTKQSILNEEKILEQINEKKSILEKRISDFKTSLMLFTQDLPSEEVSSMHATVNRILTSYNIDKTKRRSILTQLTANEINMALSFKILKNYDKNASQKALKKWESIEKRIEEADSDPELKNLLKENW